jgi:hypothetical protein
MPCLPYQAKLHASCNNALHQLMWVMAQSMHDCDDGLLCTASSLHYCTALQPPTNMDDNDTCTTPTSGHNQHDTTVCMPLGHSLRSSDQAAQPLEKLQCNESELVALVIAQLYSSTAQEPVMYTIATQTTQPCLVAHGGTRTAQTLHTPRGNETPPDDFYIYYPCTHQLSPVTCA